MRRWRQPWRVEGGQRTDAAASGGAEKGPDAWSSMDEVRELGESDAEKVKCRAGREDGKTGSGVCGI